MKQSDLLFDEVNGHVKEHYKNFFSQQLQVLNSIQSIYHIHLQAPSWVTRTLSVAQLYIWPLDGSASASEALPLVTAGSCSAHEADTTEALANICQVVNQTEMLHHK